MEPDSKQFENRVSDANQGIDKFCKNLARVFRIEELAVSAWQNEDDDDIVPVTEPIAVLGLRKESFQLLKVIRITSFYMLVLTIIYFIQAMLCLEWLDVRDFEANYWNQAYADEIYNYSIQFERMKIIHALTLASISLFVTVLTCRYRALNQLHYAQLLIVSLIVSILYFLPLIYVAYMAYDPSQQVELEEGQTPAFADPDQAEWERAMIRFADWFFMLLERSDLGGWGLAISTLIHVQIYILLLVMQWCAWHIRAISIKINLTKDACAGTYQGLEMNSTTDQPVIDTSTTTLNSSTTIDADKSQSSIYRI